MTRIAGDATGLPTPAGPYSHSVRIGELGHTAGQVGIDPATGAVAGSDCVTQTRQALANLAEALAALGAGPQDVLRCSAYLTTVEDFPAMNEEYARFFTEPFPARTTVYVGLPPGLLVEIDALVVVPLGAEGSS
ncbi:MAG: Rid family hydrolase [Pedococcus sp.]